ncbi:MAG: class I SAM-dependent methyltransferase [Acidimicrobiia bacterium]|nr:class I SAM-dependent methyltransferase [Acidimicrobiia bacterium]
MSANQQQSEAWNGPESAHYVDHADRYDHQLTPFADALLDAAMLDPGHAVLDVGCGSGATALAAAGVARRVLGIDLSRPLLDLATSRARAASRPNAEFMVADAQTHDFAPNEFDTLISQFGVMFFDDPVAAFTNLRQTLVPGGRSVFVSWQGLEANEWLMSVARALERHGRLPQLGGRANGPGMFALENPDEIRALLAAAGFTGIEIAPIDATIVVGGGGTLDDSFEFLLGTGIVRGLLSSVPAESRDEATATIRLALEAHYEPGTGVSLGAAGWLVASTT